MTVVVSKNIYSSKTGGNVTGPVSLSVAKNETYFKSNY
jgi:hypothetical protein